MSRQASSAMQEAKYVEILLFPLNADRKCLVEWYLLKMPAMSLLKDAAPNGSELKQPNPEVSLSQRQIYTAQNQVC